MLLRLLLYGILYAAFLFGTLWLGRQIPAFDRAHFPDAAFYGLNMFAYFALLFREIRSHVRSHSAHTYWAGFFFTAEIGIIWAIAFTTYGEAEGIHRIIESPGMLLANLLGYVLWAGAFGVMGVVVTALLVRTVFRHQARNGAGAP